MRILVVEDDTSTLKALELLLAGLTHEVRGAATLGAALAALDSFDPEVCIADLRLPDGDGLSFLRAARAEESRREVIVITGDGSIDTAVEAMKAGAFDYLLKPLRPAQIGIVLERLTAKRDLESEVDDLRRQLARTGRFGSMIGKSDSMQSVFDVVSKVAKSSAPVVILGESGTGKEIVAATIHQLSRRRAKPFIAINCGAVAPALIESELFGHERGAFTGAEQRHPGYFEMADGGTLFLDEVTEMAPELQVKLLRVLETRKFRRVGGVEELKVDVRILSSSNRDLDQAIKSGKLREDFYYRLHVFPISLPPLREHPEDIPLLALHFLEEVETRERGGFNEMEAGVSEALVAHRWPGNVRELRNVIHRAFVLSEPPKLRASAVRAVLADTGRPAKSESESVQLAVGDSLSTAERRLIETTVGASKGDLESAALLLGLTVKELKAKLREHRLPG